MTRIRWTAAQDRIAHAHVRGPRTVCGRPAIDERHAWPKASRCPDCLAGVGAPTSHMPEETLVAGYGGLPGLPIDD